MVGSSVKIPRFVTPYGPLFVDTDKTGLLMGNRGILRPSHFDLPQPHVPSKPWITCLIKKNGLPIKRMDVKYTKLFFLDEVTAFAAGHRPCFSCQRQRYYLFTEMWEKVTHRPATEMDARLHKERCDENGRKITFEEELGKLPSGVMVLVPGDIQPFLLLWNKLFPWTSHGYGRSQQSSSKMKVQVLTPKSMVIMLKDGFPLLINREETVHPSILEHV